ncbi:MAG: PAS domain-containing sensor histidine kinase [Candidatus Scalindua sp.]
MNKLLQALLDKLSRLGSTISQVLSAFEQRRNNTEYKHLQEQLRKLSCAVEQSPSTILITDTAGTIEYVNPKFTQLTGYTFEDAVGRNPRMLKTGKTPPEVYECLWKLITSGKEWRGEFCNKKKNGDLYWESASISPIKDGKGVITHFVAVKEDITERKRMEKQLELFNKYLEERVAGRTEELREKNVELMEEITKREQAEEQIKASLKEKEVLLNEVHHRVKNNLQIISSLLDMSSMQTQNQETIELFAESRNRVDSMALIHSQLYKSERFDEINMERHIQELSGNLLNLYSKEKTITLDIKSANVYLPVTQAVPCALVLNELISNSLKHAYSDGQQGTISISMQQSNGGTTLLKVKDNGVGIPEEIDIERTKSLGLRLTRNIVNKQLNGKMKIIRNRGTEVIIEFKNSKEDS